MNTTAEATLDKPKADLPVFTPAADIYEKDNAFHIVAEMPGVDDKNLDVTIEDNVLEITGTQYMNEFEGYKQQYQGYRQGVYKRNFKLMTDIDQDNVKAQIANGVLTIELPKAEKVQPKRIEINMN
jgi:HSP20 family molecular chaperone IbpA